MGKHFVHGHKKGKHKYTNEKKSISLLLVLSIICRKFDNNNNRIFVEEKSLETSKFFEIIEIINE